MNNDEHLAHVAEHIGAIEGVIVESIHDPVQQIHEGGKIAMRSRVRLESLSELRQIYTPGVASLQVDSQRSFAQSSIRVDREFSCCCDKRNCDSRFGTSDQSPVCR